MQSLTHDVQVAFDDFFAQRSGASSIVSGSSSSGDNSDGHEHRRMVRRLERSLSRMEAFAFNCEAQFTAIDQDILQEATHLFVDIVTIEDSVRKFADQQDWIQQEGAQLYEQCCVIAAHLLSLTRLQDAHVDALLDRVSDELFQQKTPPYSTLLVALLQLLHQHLEVRLTLTSLSTQDCLWYVSFVTTKCINDLKSLSTCKGPFAMRCFLVHFLRHLVSLKEENETMLEWYNAWISSYSDDVSNESKLFFNDLKTLGEETLESVLDLLGETSDLESVLDQTTSALALVEILEVGFALDFEKNLRSLFVGFVNSIVQNQHKHGLTLTMRLARRILPTTDRDNKAVQNAAAMVMFMLLEHDGDADGARDLIGFCSEFIPSALLTSILLPTTLDSKTIMSSLLDACPTDSPWNHIIARKIPTNCRPVDATDRALQAFSHRFTDPKTEKM